MIHLDVDVRAEYDLHRRVRNAIGHEPSEKEIQEHLDEENRRREEYEASSRAERAKRAELEEIQAQTRQRKIDERIRTRNVAPSDFARITKLEELERCSMDFDQAYCERSSLVGTKDKPLRIDLDLQSFNLRQSTFRDVIFADLRAVDFSGSLFERVAFEPRVKLQGADFERAQFSDVSFARGCGLDFASFQYAKFKERVAIEFDRNNISGATFTTTRTDIWAKLSSAYAGIFQYINLTLSGVYFGFILLKLYLFKALSTMSGIIAQVYPGELRDQLTSISPFRFVFGSQWSAFATAVAILLYQALRLFLTMQIGPLIETEKRTGYTPEQSSYVKYEKLHLFVRILGAIAILLFIYEVYELWTEKPLLVPKLTGNP
jgi:uncharacterized protein YjbI with pentapeptide repeats